MSLARRQLVQHPAVGVTGAGMLPRSVCQQHWHSRRCRVQVKATATAAAPPATTLKSTHSVPPALEAAQALVEQHGGWFAPELTDQPEVLLRQNVPFLTQQAGALPEKPRDLNHALWMYGK